jgi:hypothetical protein
MRPYFRRGAEVLPSRPFGPCYIHSSNLDVTSQLPFRKLCWQTSAMSSDPTFPHSGVADNLRELAEKLRKPMPPLIAPYSDDWKRICREILHIYMNKSPEIRRGKPLSVPDLLEIIMRPYKSRNFNEIINRHNLYDYLKGRGRIPDDAFAFVDDFIRFIQHSDPDYQEFIKEVIKRKDSEIRMAFRELYFPRNIEINEWASNNFNIIENSIYICELRKWNKYNDTKNISEILLKGQVALQISQIEQGLGRAKAIYCTEGFENLEDVNSLRQAKYQKWYGYALFTVVDKGLGGLVNLFRPEVKGINSYDYHTSSQFMFWLKTQQGDAPAGILTFHNHHLVNPHDAIDGIIKKTMNPIEVNHDKISEIFDSLTDGYLLW